MADTDLPDPPATSLPPPSGLWDASSRPATELRPCDLPLVAIASAIGVVADLAVRRPAASIAAAVLVLVVSGGLLLSARLTTRHSLLLVAAAPLFGVWLAVRASPWLTVLDLVAAGSLIGAGVASSTERRVQSFRPLEALRQPLRWVGGLIDVIPFLGRGLAAVTRAQDDTGAAASGARAWLKGVAIALPIVTVLGLLLVSGDALTRQVVSSLSPGRFTGHVVGAVGFAYIALALLFRAASTDDPEPAEPTLRLGALEAKIVMASITGLYAAFTVIQVAGALGVAESVLDDPAATADWARQGFFQLLWAAAITLAVLAVLDRRTDDDAGAWYLRLSLTTAALTVTIVAMSISRILAYSGAFGLTMLRLYSTLFAGWIGVVFVLQAVRSMTGRRGEWLAPAAAGCGLALLLALNIVNPEAVVASYNAGQHRPPDVVYLTEDLGPDAIPSVIASLGDLDPDTASILRTRLCELDRAPTPSGLSWNLGKARAHAALAGLCDRSS